MIYYHVTERIFVRPRELRFQFTVTATFDAENFHYSLLDGRPRLQSITFDGISLLEAGNTNKSICLCLIMQV